MDIDPRLGQHHNQPYPHDFRQLPTAVTFSTAWATGANLDLFWADDRRFGEPRSTFTIEDLSVISVCRRA